MRRVNPAPSTRRRPVSNRRPRGEVRLSRVANGITQRSNAASRMDNVPQVRKFTVFGSVPFTNATSDYSLGLENFNLDCAYNPLKPLLAQYGTLYEQYRIREVTLRMQVGRGYTNDRRLQTIVGCRVDVDKQLSGATLQNVQAMNGSENTVMRTLTERGNVLLARYRPIMRKRVGGATADDPVLPNQLQWYPLSYSYDHLWKGATVTVMIPEPNLAPNELAITIMQEVVVEFRGRVSNELVIVGDTLEQAPEPSAPTYDVTDTQDTLRNNLLSGAYFPMTAWPSIPTIGVSATAEQVIGQQYRVQASMEIFEVKAYDSGTYSADRVVN